LSINEPSSLSFVRIPSVLLRKLVGTNIPILVVFMFFCR
jgi:hypothetical protein